MSVITISVQPDNYVMLAADGAATDPETGAVSSYVSKLLMLPEMSAIIGITGSCKLPLHLLLHLPHSVHTFDDLVKVVPEMLKYFFAVAAVTPDMRLHKSCVVIAGWSDERQKYEAWRVVSYEKKGTIDGKGTQITLEPFKLYPVGDNGIWASVGPPPETLERFGINNPDENENDAQRLVRMVCAARADSGKPSEEMATFNAGGYIQLAHLTKDYVQSSIVHRWPEDVIGKTIDPTQGEALPAAVMEALGAQN